MNILFINSLRKNRWGGGEKWMTEAASGLNKLGHKCTIGCIPGSVIEGKALKKNISAINFNIKSDLDFSAIFKLKNILNSLEIDVLVCCQNKDVKIGGRAARKAKTKAVFSRQGLQLFSNKKRYKYPFTQLVDGIITNTKSIKEIYESFGWFTENFIHVLYNGMELPGLDANLSKQDIFTVDMDTKVIFSAGRLSEQKGFSYLIEAANICKKKGHQYHFVISGSGKLEHELQNLVAQLNLNNYVTFTGFIEDLTAYYQTADIFVLPSLFEGMPNVVMESMANGTPAIATRVNGADELILPGENGFLIDPESPHQIVSALEHYFSEAVNREQMAIDCRAHIAKNFTTEIMSKQLEALFLNQLKTKA